MKCQNFATFKKKFCEKIPPLVLVVAKDEIVKKILAEWNGPISTFHPNNFSTKKLLDELETIPLFEEKKFVHLDGLDHISDLDPLLTYAANPNPKATLLLSTETLHANSKLIKAFDSQGLVFQQLAQKPWEREKELIDQLMAQASQEGVLLSQNVAKALVAAVGKDEGLLLQELEKLYCFIGMRKEITLADLEAIVSRHPQETIWQLGEAVFRCDFAASVAIGGHLMKDSSLLALIAHLRTQMMTALEMHSHYEKGGSDALVKAFPYLKGGILEKKIASLKEYGQARFKRALLVLFEVEVQAKNSFGTPELLLELLLHKLCRSTYFPIR